MDHVKLLNEVRSQQILESAFRLAVQDREKDPFCDHLELVQGHNNRDAIIAELVLELEQPDTYIPRQAFAFFIPKNGLCYRRMVHLPLKDLVVRYAYAIVLSKYLDSQLHSNCFANRFDRSGEHLLEDYANIAWPRFCEWQEEQAKSHMVLLRTDITSFYDSVSHEILLNTLSRELGIALSSPFLELFQKLLRTPVAQYNGNSDTFGPADITRHGLMTGSSCEGVFANIYLKAIDEQLSACGIVHGRYNDDIRIFANSRKEAEDAVLSLQKTMLTMGLNLNASKTNIALDPEQMKELISEPEDQYSAEVEDIELNQEVENVPDVLIKELELDKGFGELDENFDMDAPLKTDGDAKTWCKHLGYVPKHRKRAVEREIRKILLGMRTTEHVDRLVEILVNWKGASRHATWLLVETAFFSHVSDKVREHAIDAIVGCLAKPEVSNFAKYRLLQHMIKPRKMESERYLFMLSTVQREAFLNAAESGLHKPSVIVALTTIYAFCILAGDNHQKMLAAISNDIKAPCPSPITSALAVLGELDSFPVVKSKVSSQAKAA